MSTQSVDLRDRFTEGLYHSDRFVRTFCLGYWERDPDRGNIHARRIIEAIRDFGPQAFTYPNRACQIPLNRENLHSTEADFEYAGRWLEWIRSVSGDALSEAEAFLSGDRALAFEDNGVITIKELRESIRRRQHYAGFDADACREGIDRAFAEIAQSDEFPDEPLGEIGALIDRLVEIETPEALESLAWSWLEKTPKGDQEAGDPEGDVLAEEFTFGFGVLLAGQIRLASAVDRIIDGIVHMDWDWLSEASVAALAGIPDPWVTERLRARWRELPEYGRLYFSDIFAVAHRPEDKAFCLENMRAEVHEYTITPHRFALAVALMGDADSLEKAAGYWEARADDPDAESVAEALYAIHRLRDEDPPILAPIREWLLEDEARHAAVRQRDRELPDIPSREEMAKQIPVPVKDRKIGRNELCPCGSGKKYKKCCL